jgi:uncharacterized MAPEG superfamily protein
MTVPFVCVVLAFLLTIASKGPVALAMARQPGGYDNREPRRQQAALGGWGRRALAAHQNGFEAFPAFAAAVIIAHLAGADPIWSTRLAFVFLASRAVYIPLYLSDLAIVRSLVWTLGFLATVALFLLPFAG